MSSGTWSLHFPWQMLRQVHAKTTRTLILITEWRNHKKLTFFRKPLKDAATEMDPISVSWCFLSSSSVFLLVALRKKKPTIKQSEASNIKSTRYLSPPSEQLLKNGNQPALLGSAVVIFQGYWWPWNTSETLLLTSIDPNRNRSSKRRKRRVQ